MVVAREGVIRYSFIGRTRFETFDQERNAEEWKSCQIPSSVFETTSGGNMVCDSAMPPEKKQWGRKRNTGGAS